VQSVVLGLHVVRLSVCPSVCNVGGSRPHRLEILETNRTAQTQGSSAVSINYFKRRLLFCMHDVAR